MHFLFVYFWGNVQPLSTNFAETFLLAGQPSLERRSSLPRRPEDLGRGDAAHHLQRVPAKDHRVELNEPLHAQGPGERDSITLCKLRHHLKWSC